MAGDCEIDPEVRTRLDRADVRARRVVNDQVSLAPCSAPPEFEAVGR
jgi:hypothetical protein